MDLSIAIVSYNTVGFLGECLSSLQRHPPSCDHEILVMDNASSDGSADMVRERYPEVKLTPNPRNVGYAAAVNQAFRGSDAEFVLVLNPDVVVTPGAVDALTRYMAEHPRVGIAGAKLLNPDGSLQYSCRSFYTLKTLLYRRTFLGKIFRSSPVIRDHLMADWDHSTPRRVDWVLGACMMLRRSAVADVGPADERFFLYFEDVDWCYRMKSRGWEVHYCPDSVMVHHHRRDSARGFFGPGLRAHLASVFRFYEKWSMMVYIAKRHTGWLGKATAVLGDAAAVTLAFLAAYLIRQALSFLLQKPLFAFSSYGSFLALIVAVALVSLSYFGLYRRRYDDWADELVDVGKALSVACVVVMASTFVLYLRSFSRIVLVGFWPISILAVTGLRALLRGATSMAWAGGFGAGRMLVIGETPARLELAQMLRASRGGHVEIVAPPDRVMAGLRGGGAGAAESLVGFVEEERITDILLVTADLPETSIPDILALLRRLGVRVRLHTPAAPLLTAKSTIEEARGLGLIAVDESMRRPAASAAKRAFDLALAVPGSLAFGLCAAVLWAIRRFGRAGAPFAKKTLIGRGGHPFEANFLAGGGAEDYISAGPRAKLPLVLNVLRGQLSFVGPKPLTPDEWREAGESWKGLRSNLVPGVVGSWSFSVGEGASHGELEVMDRQYLRDWSLSLDLKIIVKALAGRRAAGRAREERPSGAGVRSPAPVEADAQALGGAGSAVPDASQAEPSGGSEAPPRDKAEAPRQGPFETPPPAGAEE